MKKIMIAMLVLISVSSFAKNSNDKTTVKMIKDVITSDISPSDTCLDEYIQRRRQLILRTALGPLSGAAEIVGGTVAGLAAGAAIGSAVVNDGWAQIGYMLGGGVIMFGSTAILYVTQQTVNFVKVMNNNRMIKAVAEARLNGGKFLNKYLKKYNKKFPEDNLSLEEFKDIISFADQDGVLCDGSLVKDSIFRKGLSKKQKKLKHKLVLKKELFNYIHAQL
jgi:hypothetical protein